MTGPAAVHMRTAGCLALVMILLPQSESNKFSTAKTKSISNKDKKFNTSAFYEECKKTGFTLYWSNSLI